MSSSSGWSLFLRVGQLLSTLVPIWLTREDTLEVGVINWCLFIWPICFSLTLLGFRRKEQGSCLPFARSPRV